MLNYKILSMDDLTLELEANRLIREAIQAEIRQRAQDELTKIEARKAELLAITGPPKVVTAPKVKARKVGAPKYRNFANPAETWTGRGKKPVWMQSWIARGKDPNELLIAA